DVEALVALCRAYPGTITGVDAEALKRFPMPRP
ncbi:MAG: hypothetical protein ACI9QL_001651, partial [Candidatus Omnitrophota bacterium]